MRFDRLDLNLLVALDAMLKTRSISKAAEVMNLSQSAMSSALARLREYFGDELLIQVGRRMELTPRAALLEEAVHDVLLRIRTSINAEPSFDPRNAHRRFTLFVSDFTLQALVPRLLARTRIEAPQVEFSFLPQAEHPQRALERGEADLLVIPQEFASKDHPTHDLFVEDFVCMLSQSHALTSLALTLDRYQSARHAVMRPVSGFEAYESRALRERGIGRTEVVTTFSFMSLPHLICGTDLLATVHRSIATQACAHLPLVMRELPFEPIQIRQVMQWHKYRTLDPGLIWLQSVLRDVTHSSAGGFLSSVPQVPARAHIPIA